MPSSIHNDIDTTNRPIPAQHSAISLVPQPQLAVRDLYRPVMVTIKLEKTGTEFTIPRALICGQSAYFDRAFNE